MNLVRADRIFKVHQRIHAAGTFRRINSVDFGKPSHILLIKTDGGEQTEIIEMLIGKIVISGVEHGIRGDFQSGEKTCAQGNDEQNRQKPGEKGTDRPHRHFQYCSHTVTTRSRQWV